MNKNFPYLLVTMSPWPIIISLNLMNFLISIVVWINFKNYSIVFLMFSNLLLAFTLWNRDIVRESTFMGGHTFIVKMMIKLSMGMFILSELFFFISFFWTFFHSSISPSIEINMAWPPKMIKVLNYTEIPLLNTLTLITSGFFVTLSHLNLVMNMLDKSLKTLFYTILMGLYFSVVQMLEYFNSGFCINDSVYGSIFFISTGFHGIHVLVGTVFLMVSFARMYSMHFSTIHHINYEMSVWYWHFVDVIWLFIYSFYYVLI
uniref:cytochrome c oxidase subunit III n=1 Tax=Tetragonula iridipennis TaxID=597212 RepID=UPI0026E27326|nr:cytochrome c oxidase subunit III [Tetragonula iridipennis]WJQ22758.1 cytochrome c oxidase subunit III [Tetragonula iridipennis]